ncbi:hypothetical protein HKD37_15G041813 [Glycine soja]|nr:hypothetical protein GmHk_15G042841 [Glycine max]
MDMVRNERLGLMGMLFGSRDLLPWMAYGGFPAVASLGFEIRNHLYFLSSFSPSSWLHFFQFVTREKC